MEWLTPSLVDCCRWAQRATGKEWKFAENVSLHGPERRKQNGEVIKSIYEGNDNISFISYIHHSLNQDVCKTKLSIHHWKSSRNSRSKNADVLIIHGFN